MKVGSASRSSSDVDFERFAKPQGAPRGLLLHFILYKTSLKPVYGYQILQDIEEKTAGAWRPGPGSIYPLLKKLVSQGYIKSESPKRVKTSQRIYQITPKGKRHIQEIRKVFTSAGQKWTSLSRIFIDMLEPEDMVKFFADISKTNFEISRQCFVAKSDKMSPADIEYMMKEYSLNLQRQLEWTSEVLKGLKRAAPLATNVR